MSSERYFSDLMEGRRELPTAHAEAVKILAYLYKESGDAYDWVPARSAYMEYAKHVTGPFLLVRVTFGFALTLAFPNCPKTRRSLKGIVVPGRAELTGPGGIRTPDEYETYKNRAKWRAKHGNP